MKCGLTLLLLAIASNPATANGVFIIGDNGPLGSGTNHSIYSVSGDGSVIPVRQTGDADALVWTLRDGLVTLSSIAGPSFAANNRMIVSDDGQVIAGQTYGNDTAFRWTADAGLEILGLPDDFEYSGAWGMSADGSVLAIADPGRLTDSPPYRWTRERGFESLGLPDGYETARPGQVSADGDVIVGHLYRETNGEWELEPFRWDDVRGIEPLGTLTEWRSGLARDLSADGAVVVGSLCDTFEQPHCGGQPSTAFRWTRAEGISELAALSPGLGSQATVVSRDGSIILGNTMSSAGSSYRQNAIIWDRRNGPRKLADVLRDEYGVELPETLPLLTHVWDLSANSQVLVGNTVMSQEGGFGIQWAIYLDRPLVASSGTDGDFNGNAELDVEDLNLLSVELQSERNVDLFDVNQDAVVDFEDQRFWVHELANTYFGDANLDGEFNSGDLVEVFRAGEYEDAIEGNSTWSTGDWNGDGDFTSGDLVSAFQDGGYEQGPRHLVAVPEPSSAMLLLVALIPLTRRSRQCEW